MTTTDPRTDPRASALAAAPGPAGRQPSSGYGRPCGRRSRCSAASWPSPCSASGSTCRCCCTSLLLARPSSALLGWALWRARRTLQLASRDAGLARLERDSGAAPSAAQSARRHAARRLRRPRDPSLVGAASRAADREPAARPAGAAALGPAAARPVGAARGPAAHAGGRPGPRARRDRHAAGERRSCFGGTPARAAPAPTVDLWVTPPAYTAPPAAGQRADPRPALARACPAGSEARVQAHHLPVGRRRRRS